MPASPTIALTPEPDSGRMKVVFTNSDSPANGNNLWRQSGGGSAVKIATGIAVDGTFYDSHIASGVAYTYFGEAVDGAATAQGASQTDTVSLSRLWLHAVDKLSGAANALNALALFNLSPEQRTLGRAETEYQMSGRTAPVIIASQIKDHVFSCTIQILADDRANRQTLVDILESDRYVCLRTPNGLKMFSVLANLDVQDFGFFINVNLVLRECDFRETQDWTRADTIATATGSYSAQDVDKAIAGFYLPPKFRTRVEHLDRKNNVLNSNFQNLILDKSSFRIVADADVGRTGRFALLERQYVRDIAIDDYPDLVTANDPLFYWRLGETSGTVANDASGNGRTGTYTGGFTLAQPSLLTGALDNGSVVLNGSSGYIEIADAAWMDVALITLEAVVKTSSTAQQTLFARNDTGSNKAFVLRIEATTGNLRFIIFVGGVQKTLDAVVNVADGTVHHIAATYDGANMRLFIDGIQIAKLAVTGSIDSVALAIRAGSSSLNTAFLNGALDEAAMYGHALSPAEIRQHAKRGLAQYREVDYLYDRLKLNIGIRMTDGEYAEYPNGVFLLQNPRRTSTATGVVVEVDAYDKVMFLKNWKFSGRYVVAASTNVITAVATLLAAAGFETSEYSLTPTTLVTAAALEFEDKSSYLDAVNTLLYSINYEDIFASGAGVLIGQPYELPKDRPTTRTYVDDSDSVIVDDIQDEDNLVAVPNEINLTDTTPGITPKTSTETNVGWTNDFTVEKRGQTVREGDEVIAVNQTILDALALRELTERTPGRMVTFQTPHAPYTARRDINRNRFINDPHNPAIDDRFIEIETEVPLSETGRVTHRNKQIIAIS